MIVEQVASTGLDYQDVVLAQWTNFVSDALASLVQKEVGPLSRLLKLPDDVLWRILEYLLSTREAKEVIPHKEHYLTRYKLYPQIMRINRRLGRLGSEVLMANHFIIVLSDYPKLSQLFRNNTGYVWKSKNSSNLLNCSCLHVLIKSLSAVEETAELEHFMLCLNDLEILVASLQMFVVANQPQFAFAFHVHASNGAPPSDNLQRRLLAPFMNVRGQNQECYVRGGTEAIAQELQRKMTQRIYWTRCESRLFLKTLMFKHDLIVETMTRRKWLTAFHHQFELVTFRMSAEDCAFHITASGDMIQKEDLMAFMFLAILNSSIVCLQLAFITRDEENARRLWQYIVQSSAPPEWGADLLPSTDVAVFHQLQGVALFGLGHLRDALTSLEKALTLTVKTSFIRCYELIDAYRMTAPAKRNLKSVLAKLKGFVPSGPAGKAFKLRKSTLGRSVYEDELLPLRRLDYNGDEVSDYICFEDIEEVHGLSVKGLEQCLVYEEAEKEYASNMPGARRPIFRTDLGLHRDPRDVALMKERGKISSLFFEPDGNLGAICMKDFVFGNTRNWRIVGEVGYSAAEIMARARPMLGRGV